MTRQVFRFSDALAIAMPCCAAAMLVAGVVWWQADHVPAGWVELARVIVVIGYALLGACAIGASSVMFCHAAAAMPHGRRFRSVYVPALIFGSGFAGASAIGVHIGWEMLTTPGGHHVALPPASAVTAASIFLAAGKPVFSFVLEGRRAVARYEESLEHRRAMEDARASEAAQAAADAIRRGAATDIAAAREKRASAPRIAAVGAIGAAAALAGLGEPAPAPLIYPTHEVETPATRAAGSYREARVSREAFERISAALSSGMSRRQARDATGYSKAHVARVATQLAKRELA